MAAAVNIPPVGHVRSWAFLIHSFLAFSDGKPPPIVPPIISSFNDSAQFGAANGAESPFNGPVRAWNGERRLGTTRQKNNAANRFFALDWRRTSLHNEFTSWPSLLAVPRS